MVSLLLISILTGVLDKITQGPSTYKNSNSYGPTQSSGRVQLWSLWRGQLQCHRSLRTAQGLKWASTFHQSLSIWSHPGEDCESQLQHHLCFTYTLLYDRNPAWDPGISSRNPVNSLLGRHLWDNNTAVGISGSLFNWNLAFCVFISVFKGQMFLILGSRDIRLLTRVCITIIIIISW